jgi:hypothetical protein
MAALLARIKELNNFISRASILGDGVSRTMDFKVKEGNQQHCLYNELAL